MLQWMPYLDSSSLRTERKIGENFITLHNDSLLVFTCTCCVCVSVHACERKYSCVWPYVWFMLNTSELISSFWLIHNLQQLYLNILPQDILLQDTCTDKTATWNSNKNTTGWWQKIILSRLDALPGRWQLDENSVLAHAFCFVQLDQLCGLLHHSLLVKRQPAATMTMHFTCIQVNLPRLCTVWSAMQLSIFTMASLSKGSMLPQWQYI